MTPDEIRTASSESLSRYVAEKLAPNGEKPFWLWNNNASTM